MSLTTVIKEGAALVDVRTPEEFMSGSVVNAVNIPLNEVPHRIEELKEMKGPLVLFCRSGARSGQAQAYLSAQGIECLNGGSWMDVNMATSNN